MSTTAQEKYDVTIRLSRDEVKFLLTYDKDLRKAIHKLIRERLRKPKDPLVAAVYQYMLTRVPDTGMPYSDFHDLLMDYLRQRPDLSAVKMSREAVAKKAAEVMNALKRENFFKFFNSPIDANAYWVKIGDFNLEYQEEMLNELRKLGMLSGR